MVLDIDAGWGDAWVFYAMAARLADVDNIRMVLAHVDEGADTDRP